MNVKRSRWPTPIISTGLANAFAMEALPVVVKLLAQLADPRRTDGELAGNNERFSTDHQIAGESLVSFAQTGQPTREVDPECRRIRRRRLRVVGNGLVKDVAVH